MDNFTNSWSNPVADIVFNNLAERAIKFHKKGVHISRVWIWAGGEFGLCRHLTKSIQRQADELGVIPE